MHEQPLTSADIRVALEIAIGSLSADLVRREPRAAADLRKIDAARAVLMRMLEGLPGDDGR